MRTTDAPVPRTSRLAGIDTLRGFAALAVFACHIQQYWLFLRLPWKIPQILSWGAHGVDIFIVISGFCLMMPVALSRGDLDVRQFYGRRAWRILPAYWVALALASAIAVVPATARLTVAAPATWWDVAVHAVGMQTWFPPTLGTINGSLWSVSLEISLYIVFPVLILVWRRWGIAPLLVAALILAVLWDLAGTARLSPYLGIGFALPIRLIQFVLGMATAELVVRGRAPRGRIALVSALVLGAVAVVLYTVDADPVVQDVAWALTGSALILWLNGMGREGAVLTPPEFFGARSYSFYLLHQPALLLFIPLVVLIPGGWLPRILLGGAVCLAVTFGAAMLLFRFVEQPSHRLGRRLFPSPTPRTLTPAPATASPAS